MELKITRADGSSDEAKVSLADLIAFERKFNKSYGDVENAPHVEYVAFLAWNSLRRTGRETRSFDDFIDVIDGLDVVPDPLAQQSAS